MLTVGRPASNHWRTNRDSAPLEKMDIASRGATGLFLIFRLASAANSNLYRTRFAPFVVKSVVMLMMKVMKFVVFYMMMMGCL